MHKALEQTLTDNPHSQEDHRSLTRTLKQLLQERRALKAKLFQDHRIELVQKEIQRVSKKLKAAKKSTGVRPTRGEPRNSRTRTR